MLPNRIRVGRIDYFDTSYDVKFSTYAVPMISGEIKRFLRDDGMIKVSRSLKENLWKIQKAREALNHKKGREASLSELCACTGLAAEDVITALAVGIVSGLAATGADQIREQMKE